MALITAFAERHIETSGVGQVKAFSIKANGKAFKVLIDGLYSDKVRSVIREIWTNAYDAHVMADKADIPFDCHLPTVFEPEFRVRDYGVSMTHEGVMTLYSTVFESSKEYTNEQVGKLGLGSKSPFAYTDTFTVTAWLNGEKRTYSAFIGADYVPQIAHMLTEPSSEPTGFEVAFPVRSADIVAFTDAAQKVIVGFVTPPKMVGAQIVVSKMEPHIVEEGWTLYKRTYGAAITTAQARQGCVLYPISTFSLGDLTGSQISLLNSPIVIDFPIGSLEISASRESLGYDEPTIKNIVSRLDAIIERVSADFTARLDACTTVWDALLLRKEMLDDGSIPTFVRDFIRSRKFHNIDLGERNDYVNYKGLARHDIHITKLDKSDMYRSKGPSLDKENTNTRGGFHFEPGTVRIYFHDTAAGKVPFVTERIRRHYNEGRYQSDHPTRILYVRTARDSIGLKRLLVKMGRPPESVFVDVATLPEIPKEQRTRQPVKMKKIHYGSLEPVDVDLDKGGFYIPLIRDNIAEFPAGINKHVSYCNLEDMFKALQNYGLIDSAEILYGMPKSLARTANRDNWYNMLEVAAAFFDAYYDPNKVGVVGVAKKVLEPNGVNDARRSKALRFALRAGAEKVAFSPSGVFGELMEHIADLEKLTHVSPEVSIIDEHLVVSDKERPLPKMEDMRKALHRKIDAFYEKYPMFEMLSKLTATWENLVNDDMKEGMRHAADYISMIDSK